MCLSGRERCRRNRPEFPPQSNFAMVAPIRLALATQYGTVDDTFGVWRPSVLRPTCLYSAGFLFVASCSSCYHSASALDVLQPAFSFSATMAVTKKQLLILAAGLSVGISRWSPESLIKNSLWWTTSTIFFAVWAIRFVNGVFIYPHFLSPLRSVPTVPVSEPQTIRALVYLVARPHLSASGIFMLGFGMVASRY